MNTAEWCANFVYFRGLKSTHCSLCNLFSKVKMDRMTRTPEIFFTGNRPMEILTSFSGAAEGDMRISNDGDNG
ncbi:MAG: hypothetical protein PHY54_15675 [Methylococcales bacterium]|nr:hypothetical protein [Methylococcales bacterium]